MNRRLKGLGLALLAMFALTAVAASAASASNFESSNHATTVTGTQSTQHVFTVDSGTVKCTTATFSGTFTGTSVASVTLKPHYTGCKAFGLNATIDVNNCDYLFTNTGGATVTADVQCGTGAGYIAVTAPGCEVRVGPQNGLGTIGLTNIAGGDISANINVTEIVYDEIGESCVGGPGTKKGTYTGTATLDGNDTSSNISYT